MGLKGYRFWAMGQNLIQRAAPHHDIAVGPREHGVGLAPAHGERWEEGRQQQRVVRPVLARRHLRRRRVRRRLRRRGLLLQPLLLRLRRRLLPPHAVPRCSAAGRI
jgi:hypothetical protein